MEMINFHGAWSGFNKNPGWEILKENIGLDNLV